MTGSTWTDPDLGKAPEVLLEERSRRFDIALAMGQPDRIPVPLAPGYLLAEMNGVPHAALFDEPEAAQQMLEGAALHFGADAIGGVWNARATSAALGDRMTKWPGYGLGPNGSFQFHEAEFMKAADYDAWNVDPSDWALRTYLPRAFEALEPLAKLPPMGMAAFGYYHLANIGVFGQEDVVGAFEALADAARRQRDHGAWVGRCVGRLRDLGFPQTPWAGPIIEAPFDFMSDTMRGMKGIFLDLRQRPAELLAAQEKALRIQVDFATWFKERTGARHASIPLHRGSDGFMSIPQFEKFYWPQLKEMLLRLIDAGITPNVFYEGVWDKRLAYLAELPKGATIGRFQSSDMLQVKEVLGDVMSVMGGMPTSLLKTGPVGAIRELTHEVCERVGKGGGFVMQPSISELEGCNPVFVKAWIDATKEFGVYAAPA